MFRPVFQAANTIETLLMDFRRIAKLSEQELQGRRVLVRVNFNVPTENGALSDDLCIRAALPTIQYLQQNDARVILLSDFGPESPKRNAQHSMEIPAMRLAELLESGEVFLTDACVGDGARSVISSLREGQVCVLENVAFHEGEVRGDDKLAKELASFADIFVNDALSKSHLARASTDGVARHMRICAAGLQLEKELNAFEMLLGNIERPYVAVLGAQRFAEVLPLMESLLLRANVLILGGAMAATFAAARGMEVGNAPIERGRLPLARDFMTRAETRGVQLLLPQDYAVAQAQGTNNTDNCAAGAMNPQMQPVDIGTESIRRIREVVTKSGTVFWCGLMSLDGRKDSSLSIARAIAGASAFSVVAGDVATQIVRDADLEKGFNHVSMGGLAALQMLEGKALPGIAALIK